MNEKERAVELFKEGFNCSQAVFTAFAHRFGIDEDTAKKISARCVKNTICAADSW